MPMSYWAALAITLVGFGGIVDVVISSATRNQVTACRRERLAGVERLQAYGTFCDRVLAAAD